MFGLFSRKLSLEEKQRCYKEIRERASYYRSVDVGPGESQRDWWDQVHSKAAKDIASKWGISTKQANAILGEGFDKGWEQKPY